MKIRSPWITALAARLAVLLFRLLFFTCRVRVHVARPETNPYQPEGGEPALYCVWHDSLVVPVFAARSQQKTAALVSRHQDGTYLAKALELVGLGTVRGSTSRGGAAAVRQLMTVARDRHVVITPDGPRGPRRELKPGIIFLASHAGRPIIPTAHAASRAWRIRGSWTDLMIPKPFSNVYMVAGEPIHVPPDLSRDGIAHYKRLVEDAMAEVDAEANRLACGEETASPALRRAA